MPWLKGPDGLLERSAARILAFDPNGRILLLRGHDEAEPERSWWFTVGGGIDPGESPRQAAVREFFEETSIEISTARLIGPVARRESIFHFAHHDRRQFEEIFIAHLTAQESEVARSWNKQSLSAPEMRLLDELAWWDIDELERTAGAVEVYPIGIAGLSRSWWAGWDGEVLELFEE